MSRKTLVDGLIGLIIVVGLVFSYYVSQINVLPQASYRLLDQIGALSPTDRVLLVSPHQDDEILGAGGFLRDAAANGAAVEVVFATDGDKHGLKVTRHAEALRADAAIGLTSNQVKFLDFPDGNLTNQTAFDTRLKSEIDSFRPTLVITTLPDDLHPDHAACGRTVRQIAESERGAFKVMFFLIHYHRYPRPIGDDTASSYLLPPSQLIARYDWSAYPLSATTQKVKARAISDYQSQLSPTNPVLRQLLLSFNYRNELFATAQN